MAIQGAAPSGPDEQDRPFDLDAVLAGLSGSVGQAFDLIGEASTPTGIVSAALTALIVARDEGADRETMSALLAVLKTITDTLEAVGLPVPEREPDATTVEDLRDRFTGLLERRASRHDDQAHTLLTLLQPRARSVRRVTRTHATGQTRAREHRSTTRASRRTATATSGTSSGDPDLADADPERPYGWRWQS